MSWSRASRREFLRLSAMSAAAASVASGRHLWGASRFAPFALEKRRFGKTDMQVAVLGFGGAEIGYEKTDQATVARLLNAALDAGLNVVDTAECYIDSEVQIGEAIGKRRKDYYLFTKCGHVLPDEGRGEAWSKEAVLASVERSLKRLKTDVIDLVQLHSCSQEELEKGACIEGLELAKKQGKTRYIGYSGDSEAAKYAVETGRFDTLMTSISIADQEAIDLFLPKAREREMGVIVKRGIANAAWRYDKKPDQGYHVEYWERLQKLDFDFCKGELRKDEGPDGAAGIALRFTLGLPGVHTSVVGTTNPERFAANRALLAAGPLPQAQVDAIRKRWKEVAKPDWIGQT